MKEHNEILYREIQRPRQFVWWMIILVHVAFIWYWFIKQITFGVIVGDNPASDTTLIIIWIIFGILFPVYIFGVLKLITEVRNDGIYIRLVPFHFQYKKFLFKDIRHYKSSNYSPLKRFGGWGIRINLNGETAYNMYGKEGLELELTHDKVVIGTQKVEKFKKAIDSAQKNVEN